MFEVSKRKLTRFLKTLIFSLIIFLVTVIICIGLFLFLSLKRNILVSPLQSLSRALTTSVSQSKIRDFCNKNHIDCRNVQNTDDSLILTIGDNSIVYFSTKKDIDKQLTSLQQAISQLTIKGKQFRTLDFRYESVVATF